jgi:phage portal protein BeeE
MLTAGILARYVREVVATGGVPMYTLETDQSLTTEDAQDLLTQWIATRANASLSSPPILDSNVTLKTHMAMSPRDMAMLEIAQFTESRIAVLLGVPPYLVALAGPANSSMPYANVSQLFDFHDRASLKTKANFVMAALSWWALPSTQRAELNRDEYTRPSFAERADAWVKLVQAGIVSVEEVRTAERFTGSAPAVAITGGLNDPMQEGATL